MRGGGGKERKERENKVLRKRENSLKSVPYPRGRQMNPADETLAEYKEH